MPARLVTLAVLGGALTSTLVAQTGERTVRDGVFSPSQAERGARLFEAICTACHEIADFTADGAYLEGVAGEPLSKTFEYISSEMPEDDPGSLRPEEYAAVLAYLLSAFGLPNGTADLAATRESLESITIVRPALPGR